jgi:hypothetical protein
MAALPPISPQVAAGVVRACLELDFKPTVFVLREK